MRASSASAEVLMVGDGGAVIVDADEIEDCRVSSFLSRPSTPDMRLRRRRVSYSISAKERDGDLRFDPLLGRCSSLTSTRWCRGCCLKGTLDSCCPTATTRRLILAFALHLRERLNAEKVSGKL